MTTPGKAPLEQVSQIRHDDLHQNPVPDSLPPENFMAVAYAYSALVLFFLASAPLVWIFLVVMGLAGVPVLPREPRRAVPWGLVDLVLGFVLLVGLSAVGMQLFPFEAKAKPPVATQAEPVAHDKVPAEAPADEPAVKKERQLDQLSLADARKMISLDSGVKLLVAVLLIAAIAIRLRPSAADWGWTLAHWQRDVVLGVGTFLATFAPMIGLQAALVFGLGWKYEHPMIDLVTRTKDPLLFGLSALAAAVVAPLFEEFVFRGLLQGWLEKVFSGGAGAKSILLGGPDDEPLTTALPPAQVLEYSATKEPIDLSPYASPQPDDAPRAAALPAGAAVRATPFDWLAIVCSMLVFSLLHFSHGPAWIPLLIFGAVVGFVYQRTHRLWPGVIAHMLLNATTIFGLWVQVFIGIPK